MLAPTFPDNEAARVHAIQRMDFAGPERDERCQRYARLARVVMDTPMAMVTIVGPDAQWFRGCEGLAVTSTSRAVSFCGHAILQDGLFMVGDARQDPRFADNPLVTGEPGIRFYAGCPIVLPGELAVGTLCVIDRVPRAPSPAQLQAFGDLAECLRSELTTLLSVADMNDVAKQLFRLLPAHGG
ncbi:GAF domain-containing protein [Cognatilysobacter segetis]|uniref:GAF domain-containing protein n=1 Tax=Cognatilysobacter segetis TaxID=2492394 RepID=UPI00105B8DD6|nr:GAF domain-containing protein [Lysobacter segetis]